MAEMAVTVAGAAGTLRPCTGVSARGAAVLGRWRPLALAAPAKLRSSSSAVRVPRATSPAAVEVHSIGYHKALDELACSTGYTLISRMGATLIQTLSRKL
jgi:hypothetical protein